MDNEQATQINADDYKVICIVGEENMLILESKETKEMIQIPMTSEVIDLFNINVENNQGSSDLCQGEQNEINEYSSPILDKTKFWGDKAIRFLIWQYSINEEKFKDTKIKNDTVWKSITNKLIENGFNFNVTQVINKWKHLRKQYIKEKDSMGPKSTGSEPVTFKFYEDMDALFDKKPNIKPVALASSSQGSQIDKDVVAESFSQDLVQKVVKKRKLDDDATFEKKPRNTLLQWLEKREERRENEKKKRHTEIIAAQKDAQNVFKNMMEKLIEKL